jgi:hypothetical protein
MKKECLSRLDDIEDLRRDMVSEYNSYTEQQLIFKPEPGHWNLLQVLDHIVTSEKMSSIYIKRQLTGKKYPPAPGLKSTFRFAMLRLAFKLPFRYKAPSIVDSTGKTPNLNTLKDSWKTIRQEIITITKNTDSELLDLGVFKHPRAGLLDMKRTLEFMDIHIRHHQKQIQRITGHERFPA